MSRSRLIWSHMLWLASCLPHYVRFRHAVRHPRRYQLRKLKRLLRDNRETDYGRQHGFSDIHDWSTFQGLPLTDGGDYRDATVRVRRGEQQVLTRDPVTLLQPTSGTSSMPKLIPHTVTVAREFQAALGAWMVDLFRQRPKLLLGPQYWMLSPTTRSDLGPDAAVPIGFLDDDEYFGARQRKRMGAIMAVPSAVSQIHDAAAHQYVTTLFLLRAQHLRLISVWHPSSLLLLLDDLKRDWVRCLDDVARGGIDADIDLPADLREELSRYLPPNRRRWRELSRLDPAEDGLASALWPQLQVISCWGDGHAKTDMTRVEDRFPGVWVQPKGLLATEGVVTIPVGPQSQHVCAVTSHVLELMDDDHRVHPVQEAKLGHTYQVVLTTGAGHYRYRLGDRVEVTGFMGRTPCLRFLGRAGVVSDRVGEKLHLEHAEQILSELGTKYDLTDRFVTLVPSHDPQIPVYRLLLEAPQDGRSPLSGLADALETRLCTNYHYRHARELGQLAPASVNRVPPGMRERYRAFMVSCGAIAGTVKYPALCLTPGVEVALTGMELP